ncbi:MAG: porin family protein [Proteobacteria bacterium]|nr:porin family protein [Pseudomonadota bacterium]
MNIKTLLTIACAASATFLAAPAMAGGTPFYIGATLGASKTASIGLGANMTKSSDVVAGVLAGYRITPNFGIEGFYTGAGKFNATVGLANGNGKVDVFGIDAIGWLPIAGAFSAYGKLGLASAKTTASFGSAGLGGATRTAATYGLGVQYAATPALDMRVGWDRFGAAVDANGTNSNFHADVWSAGIVYHFQ